MYKYPGMEAGIMNGDYQAAQPSAFRFDRAPLFDPPLPSTSRTRLLLILLSKSALNFPENDLEVNQDPSPPRIDMSSYLRSCSSASTTLHFLVATRTNPVERLR